MCPSTKQEHQLLLLLEEHLSTYNGQETTMQEVSFDSLGPKLLALILPLTLMLEFKKFTVTKLEDVDQMILPTQMEEILDPQMEAQEPAKLPLLYLAILLTEPGPFNGLGSEEPSL
jgi:hypothetical protein